ncbi:MAG: substrate-binding domain-containing protein, partial [Chitinispirillaceae bacterium]|nr:substrate-binding domain-containing protein [Chitinispirillaceae bacterium]
MERNHVISAALFLLLAGCGNQNSTPRVIGVSLLSIQNEFYRTLDSGLQQEAAKRGYRLLLTSAEYNPATQTEQIRDFIHKKVDAILVAACDSKAIGEPIELANKANIPVFTVDIANTSSRGEVVSHITSDNKEGGRQCAQLMAKGLGGRGTVVIINHPGVTSVLDRVAGFREAMAKYPDIQIISDVPAWGQRDLATAIMEDILLKIPEVNGVFCINDDCAMGVLAATVSTKNKIIIVGYDATPEAKKAIA